MWQAFQLAMIANIRKTLMNILVYSGNGTSAGSVQHTMLTLKSQLSKNYDVIPIDATGLLNEPWPKTTALLVIPGRTYDVQSTGRQIPFLHLQTVIFSKNVVRSNRRERFAVYQ